MQTKSFLEVLDVETLSRTIVWKDSDIIEAPNWHPDGFLLVNSNGKLYKIWPESQKKEEVFTDFATTCNNDHGLSPDGTQIVISHEDGDPLAPVAWQSSKIYILPIQGGTPQLVTKTNTSFWHGWSPCGKTLVYTALRNGQWDIYSISVTGENETQLTSSKFHHDGAEYSPCGTYIYYNSYDSGTMEIWRMKANGTEHTQITDDSHSNWFPHISPNGQKLVYLCYVKDQKELHPFGQDVLLKIIDLKTMQTSHITDIFYGGQGTINVHSWSPDGKKIAFVRYG